MLSGHRPLGTGSASVARRYGHPGVQRPQLSPASGNDVGNYAITVNNVNVAPTSAAVSSDLTLTLPAGSLKAGDHVTVSWSGLQGTEGQPVTSGSWVGKAG